MNDFKFLFTLIGTSSRVKSSIHTFLYFTNSDTLILFIILTSDLKGNCKPFYNYLRSKRVLKTCIGSLKKSDGTLTNDVITTAEVLADAFSSVYTVEPDGPLREECYKTRENDISDIHITFTHVERELQKLNISKSQGPDGVHPKLLKSLSASFSFVTSVTQLFKKCASSGKIPSQWKEANVTALYKKGSKRDPLNYRPVSLTSIVCKLYEKLIRRHVWNHVVTQISEDQHGFVEKKSCLSNLLESVDSILDLLEDGEPVDVFYFDFRKAFDSVPHYRLLTKIEGMGVTGKTLDIIRDFLTGRTMRTRVGEYLSEARKVVSGVPQGSVLGPLLFVLFINDLPGGLDGIAKLFADDLKLIVNPNDYLSINNDLHYLQQWEANWLLYFNPSKCKIMHIDYNSNPHNKYEFNGVELGTIEQEKDLGVLTSCTLKWDENMKACIAKANSMIAWVTRNLISRKRHIMLNVYKSIIRPHLEYCTQLWSPVAGHGNWSYIMDLEKVQRRFTSMIDDIGTLPYSQRLENLKLTTLAERRIRGDLIEAFKITNSLVPYGKSLFEMGRYGNTMLSRPSNSKDSGIKKLVNSFISQRVIGYWNKLPIEVKFSDSVDHFKVNLESYKSNCIMADTDNFWEVSNILINKIESDSYLLNREKHVKYLKANPDVAKRKGIRL